MEEMIKKVVLHKIISYRSLSRITSTGFATTHVIYVAINGFFATGVDACPCNVITAIKFPVFVASNSPAHDVTFPNR